eukprot:Lankesteria_metandrocarpae@DN7199_c0_g1_i1.p1
MSINSHRISLSSNASNITLGPAVHASTGVPREDSTARPMSTTQTATRKSLHKVERYLNSSAGLASENARSAWNWLQSAFGKLRGVCHHAVPSVRNWLCPGIANVESVSELRTTALSKCVNYCSAALCDCCPRDPRLIAFDPRKEWQKVVDSGNYRSLTNPSGTWMYDAIRKLGVRHGDVIAVNQFPCDGWFIAYTASEIDKHLDFYQNKSDTLALHVPLEVTCRMPDVVEQYGRLFESGFGHMPRVEKISFSVYRDHASVPEGLRDRLMESPRHDGGRRHSVVTLTLSSWDSKSPYVLKYGTPKRRK